MNYFSPKTRAYTFVISGIFLGTLLLTGCSDQMITAPNTVPSATETSVTQIDGYNQEAPHNETEVPSYAQKNGENSTTYGGDHNL